MARRTRGTNKRLMRIVCRFNNETREYDLDDEGKLKIPKQIDPLLQQMLLQNEAINLDDLMRFCDPLPHQAKNAIIYRATHGPNELQNLDVNMIIQCMCILFEIPENVFDLLLSKDKIRKLFVAMLFIILRINMDYSLKQIILLVYLRNNLNKQHPHVPFRSESSSYTFVRYVNEVLLAFIQQESLRSTEELRREQQVVYAQLLLLMQQPQIQQLMQGQNIALELRQRPQLRQVVQHTLQLQIISIQLQGGLTVPTPRPPLEQTPSEIMDAMEPLSNFGGDMEPQIQQFALIPHQDIELQLRRIRQVIRRTLQLQGGLTVPMPRPLEQPLLEIMDALEPLFFGTGYMGDMLDW